MSPNELEMSSINVTDLEIPKALKIFGFSLEGRNAIGFRHPSVFSKKRARSSQKWGPLVLEKQGLHQNPFFVGSFCFFHGQISIFDG